MLRYSYVAMLLFTIVGSFWLEIVLKVAVLRRVKRVVLSILPVALSFLIWDAYAISRKHWYFDPNQTLGIKLPFSIPIEECLFFIVVPLAAILTIEAVRSVKTNWSVGDE